MSIADPTYDEADAALEKCTGPDVTFTDHTGQTWTWPSDFDFKYVMALYSDQLSETDRAAIMADYQSSGSQPMPTDTTAPDVAVPDFLPLDLGTGPLAVSVDPLA